MAVKMTTPMAKIEAAMKEKAENFRRRMIDRLCALGEECLKVARDRWPELSWIDRSGNLRSSIGYAVVHNGQIVMLSSFEQVKDGKEGTEKGPDFVKELARKYINGFALIVVAGMEYAAYVEAMDNKDVLASTELFARKEAANIMRKLM